MEPRVLRYVITFHGIDTNWVKGLCSILTTVVVLCSRIETPETPNTQNYPLCSNASTASAVMQFVNPVLCIYDIHDR